MIRICKPIVVLLLSVVLLVACAPEKSADTDWAVYLGDSESSHFSPLDQITQENVSELERAWTFDASQPDIAGWTVLECNPLIVDGTLYGTAANKNLFALDAATGEEIWRFDPYEFRYGANMTEVNRGGSNRGISRWTDGKSSRLFYSSEDWLIAIDAVTGKPIDSFGENGKVELKRGLGREIGDLSYRASSPGIVFENLIIMGGSVSESLPAAPGHIRAFDVLTGEQVWRFNTIPHPGEFGYETWPEDAYLRSGGANVWTGMTLDAERELVYCPTGSASFDYYGGDRVGQNLFANTLLCLDARTGKRVWHYQMVHHDLLDIDLPSPPNLFTMNRGGEKIPAVAQATKSGHIFVFNRVTGEPLFEIEERPVPQSDVPGEQSWPTQPRPVKPPPFVRERMTIDDVTDISPESREEILAKYKTLAPHEPFRPPSEKRDTIVLPGMWGGAEWGGAAVDPNGILYLNANEVPAMLRLLEPSANGSQGQGIYQQQCVACHGVDLSGGIAFGQVVPTLVDIADRKTSAEIEKSIRQGSAAMPPFLHLTNSELHALVEYLLDPEAAEETGEASSGPPPSRFVHTGNNMWLDSKGYPAIKPPWGTLNAIDLNSGEIVWKTVFGEYPELLEQGLPPTGRISWGGPVATAGGVLFIAANLDGYIRAYDMRTGEEIWRDKLPVGGYATPSVYEVDGKQYLVIACGGGRGTPEGDLYVAYALP